MDNVQIANEYVKSIIGKGFFKIGRMSNILCFHFGKETSRHVRNGRLIKRGEIALHVQTYWRVIDTFAQTIILSANDFYLPNDEIEKSDEYDSLSFDWDEYGNNLFDQKADLLEQTCSGAKVLDCRVKAYMDLDVVFSNGLCLEVISDNTRDDQEIWRILHLDKDLPHFVAFGNQIVLPDLT